MKKHLIALAAVAASLAAPLAQAQDTGSLLVRARALYLDSANKDSTGLDLSVNNKWFPEVDISYFFTPNLAAELVLTYPQKHDLRAGGAQIGTLKHLPPTLSLQYHVTGLQGFRPYFGAGINYTRFSNVSFDPAIVTALDPSIKKNSFGLAIGAGVDVPLQGGWLLNLDVKKVQIKTKVYSFGAEVGTFKVDPVLFSLGVGYRF
ncbi:OmpW family outer membrane protein [uncultured Azohydromonas sp.]|jgi:Outer membrane protein W|uniref:OmpW/AlkL family protein n=1 Tax=uncultured Azohydromonas sp. TaxID=487342 RepID=UPI002638B091|nr:OmpW family outer membrane protein [uncultured Azohydromonas sp.]